MRYKNFLARLALCSTLLAPAFVTGCAGMNNDVGFDLASQPVIYSNQEIRRDAPLVYVSPAENAEMQLTALFMPFRMTQAITNPEMIGYSQGRIVWQTWLSKRLFSIMEFNGDNGPYRRDTAIRLAREKGADLAIGGFVTYYNPGGPDGFSQLALQIEIYDASSGELLWSMAQSAMVPARKVNDYIVLATETRGPSDPMYALARTIASDTGDLIAKWVMVPQNETKPAGLLDRLLGRSPKKTEAAPQPPYPSF